MLSVELAGVGFVEIKCELPYMNIMGIVKHKLEKI